MQKVYSLLFVLTILLTPSLSEGTLYLRNNLKKAQTGDFIVTAQNKCYTVLLVSHKAGNTLRIEEISVPAQRKAKNLSWREWVKQGAPNHTSWVMYQINLSSGKMEQFYSFSKNAWFEIRDAENFLGTLLNLQMTKIPPGKMKRVGKGTYGKGRIWQPHMIVDGQVVPNIHFDAWRTYWPKDGTELSGKTIEVYLPDETSGYTSYFPYWLQIKGIIGKAKVRIIDSGSHLQSPHSKN